MATRTVTPAQERVLDAVQEIGTDGWPVRVRDVTKATGTSSPSTAHRHLVTLERAGMIVRNPRGDGWRISHD